MLSNDFQFTEAILLLDDCLEVFQNQKENPLYDVVLKLLIDNAIKASLKQDALRYIHLRKESLPILNKDSHLLDMIAYKKAFNEPYFSLIDQLIHTDVSKEIKSTLLFERLLFNKDNYDLALKDIELLKRYPNESLQDSIRMIYYYLLYNNDKETLKSLIELDSNLYLTYYKLLMLLDDNNEKQVQIVEVEFEKDFVSLPYDMQLYLYKRLFDFYKEDKISYELYKKKYDKVSKLKDKKEELEQISILKVPKKKDSEETPTLKIESTSSKMSPSIFNQDIFYKLDRYMLSIIGLSRALPFHEFLRQMCIHMERFFEFSDILFNFNNEVYHYKKERLYEKRLSLQQLQATILGVSASKYIDIIEHTKNIKYDYDIIKEMPLSKTDIKNVYCYGLENKSSVCFYQKEEKELLYDELSFKLLSNFISYEIKNYHQYSKLKSANKTYSALFESPLIALSILKDPILGNGTFYEMFDIDSPITFSDFLFKINAKDRIKYKELMDSLLRKEIVEFELKIHYEEKNILIKHVYLEAIYGYYIDITPLEKDKETWMQKAKSTPYKTLTLHGFEHDFDTYIKGKSTFILIELANLESISSIYGKDISKTHFIEFSSKVSAYGNVHQFDESSVLLVLTFNDIRSVEKVIHQMYRELPTFENALKKPFDFHMGIIRYPINTKEKNIQKIYAYLSTALYKGKQTYKNYSYFNYEDYQQEVFETEVIKQIDRLILQESLDITFTQIVNQTTNKVYAYDIGLHSDTLKVNPRYYFLVAKKKNVLEVLEKYLLKKTFKTLEEIYKVTKKYIRLSVNISAETLRSRDFIPFLLGLFKTHRIPYSIIDIIILMKEGSLSDYEKTKELHDLGIKIGTDQLSMIKEPQTSIFHYKEKPGDISLRFLNFIDAFKAFSDKENMDFVVYHVDSQKDKLLLKTKQIAYIRGETVDKTFTYEEILKLIKGVK